METSNIKNFRYLQKQGWKNPYIQRDFEVDCIEEFKYLLKNYLDKFAFKVTYNTFEYTVYKEDKYVYIRNDDTYNFEKECINIITAEYHLKDDNIDNVIEFIKTSQVKGGKRRVRVKFIHIEEDDHNKIEDLLNKGLIKYFYGKDTNELNFIYLAENENIIANTLSSESEYYISDVVDTLSSMFDGSAMTIKNLWDDEIYICNSRILDLINDNLYDYIPENKQEEIFNAEIPSDKLKDIFNEIGRNQIKAQIEELLMDVNKAEFM